MRLHCCLAVLAGIATTTDAQFTSPPKASFLEAGRPIDIKWNTTGLVAPVSIDLVSGGVGGQAVVAQQVAVSIQNIGILNWTPDNSIVALPSFVMVITDAAGRVVVSEEFVIASLVKQHGFATQVGTNVLTGADDSGVVATRTVISASQVLLPLPTQPIKIHMSGTQVLDTPMTGVDELAPTSSAGGGGGLKPLPGLDAQKQLGELKPLPNVAVESIASSITAAQPQSTETATTTKLGGKNSTTDGKNNTPGAKKGDMNKGGKANTSKNMQSRPKSNPKKPMVKRDLEQVSGASTQEERILRRGTDLQGAIVTLVAAIPTDENLPRPTRSPSQNFNEKYKDSIPGGPNNGNLLSRPPGADTTISTSISPTRVGAGAGAKETSIGGGNHDKSNGDSSSQNMRSVSARFKPRIQTVIFGFLASILLL
ncbi:hypothetical protein QQS21_010261 [Conoideocrella luteorostrata]|uniref:Uncharacterized protein n=1 Tax=Conoideocrella luteorostrata TaxID=1105319 RepID=A0AAJ0CFC6_9HYPO|nr:hypothetical protein QQS21_010261 [Conoideocrella luteorostrata]